MRILRRRKNGHSLYEQLLTAAMAIIVICALTYLPFLAASAYPTLKFICFKLAPSYWRSLCRFLTPPYVFLLLNFIIATLLFTSSQRSERGKASIITPPKAAVSDDAEISMKAAASDDAEISMKAAASDDSHNSMKAAASSDAEISMNSATSDDAKNSMKAAASDDAEISVNSVASDDSHNSMKAAASDDAENSMKAVASDDAEDSMKAAAFDEAENSEGEARNRDSQAAAEKSCHPNCEAEEVLLQTSCSSHGRQGGGSSGERAQMQIPSQPGESMAEIWECIKREGEDEAEAHESFRSISGGKKLQKRKEGPLLLSHSAHQSWRGKGSSDLKPLSITSARNPPGRKAAAMEAARKAIHDRRRPPLSRRRIRKAQSWDSSSFTRSFALRKSNKAFGPLPRPPLPQLHELTSDPNSANSLPSPHPLPSSRSRREPSMSSEELKKRVEAFIAHFNKQIRLQRQESILRHVERTGRMAP